MLRPILMLAGWAALLPGSVQGALLFDYGAPWRYLIGQAEASAPDAASWRRTTFDDSRWTEGATPIGYANPPNSPPEFNLATLLPSSGEAGYLSVFLRRQFVVRDPAAVRQLTLTLGVDDGFVAWVNGVEVGRFNVPGGELLYNAAATSAMEPTTVATPVADNLASLLVPGANVIAVQVFNAALTSSDLFVDAALESELEEAPPLTANLTPPSGSVVSELDSIAVVFSANVQGVDAADLWVNGVPASTLKVVSPREYVFSFPTPEAGTVRVEWAPGHGISDLRGAPFAGGSWNYTLVSGPLPATVVISEFMADNEHGIRDDDNRRSDWIELYNFGTEAVNLDGWFLTDDPADLTQWPFPPFSLKANSYLLVWASGEDRTQAPAPLHTNFSLDKDGGFLALVDLDTNIVSTFAPAYPPQPPDVSYGRDAADPSITGYFANPTPGVANATTGPGFAPEPVFSVGDGVFTNSTVTVALSAPSGEIRFTQDGSVPAASSTLYTSPLTVTASRTIKARVFQDGLLPGTVVARTYLLVDNSVAGFKSKLPLLFISTSGRGIVDHPPPGTTRTFGSLLAVDTFRGLSSPLGTPDYLGQCGISIRGQSSAGFPKRPYRLELQDAYRRPHNAGLFGLPADDDWILYNPYTDKPFLQNFLAYELFEEMGHYSVRRRFVELFVQTTTGRISYPRDYAGIYLLLEKIQVDKDRVDLEEMTPYAILEPEIQGGYMFKKDKDSAGDRNFSTQGGAGFSPQALKVHAPGPREITTPQLNWLVNYLRQFERALYASNWKSAVGTNHYSWYLDVGSFVDNHWIVEYTKQIDGYRLSNYLQKDRYGKLKMEPIWDWNLSFGNADYLDGWRTNGWYYTLIGENEHIWLRRLICGTTSPFGTTGDPDFNQRIADRWSELRTNVFATDRVLARVDELAAVLSEAASRDFQKWPRLGTYVWPNPSFYVTPTTYAGVVTAMKHWIQGRYAWIDSQFIIPPRLSSPGGRVPSGFQLTLEGTGSLYYTLDGSDPRLPGGGLSSKAVAYTGPVQLSTNARLVARSRGGTKWSGPSAGTFIVAPASLIVSEIMYHPAPPPEGSSFADEDFEFLELKNAGNAPLDLLGFRLVGDVDFVLPGQVLPADARILVVKNRAAFESRYGAGLPVVGEYVGQLSNSGGRLTVLGPFQETVLSFRFDNAWYPVTDGPGFSLVLADERLSSERMDEAANWRPGTAVHGSPGQPKPPARPFPLVVISEALTRPAAGSTAVELQNLSATAADLSGWFLTDNFERPPTFRIPSGTILPPGGFVVFTGADFRSPAALVPFSLDPLGEELYLFSGDPATNLTGYVHGFKYGALEPGATLGRHVNSVGDESLVWQSAPTLSGSNAPPAVPPVVIHEIMYRPLDVAANEAVWNNTEDEYLELHNRSASAIALFDPARPAEGWSIRGEVDFVFPTGATIPAGGFLVLVGFNPALAPTQLAALRQKYRVPDGVPILGPYEGSFANQGGKVRLFRPGTPMEDGTAPEILLEEVAYASDAPWPSGADGLGHALCRREAGQFGNDPANWIASTPTPGGANVVQPEPAIIKSPAGQLAFASQDVRLTVLTSSPGGIRYQWRFNGRNLPGAQNATLVLTNGQPQQSGAYSVVLIGLDSSSTSGPAYVFIGRDGDADGMDDDWELAHGLNPFDPGDALADTDADGVANRDEYLAGTDPHDPRSCLRVDQIDVGDETTLAFKAVAWRGYTLQYADSLSPPLWDRLADIHSRDRDRTATVVDPAIHHRRYYRLVTPVQP